MTVDDLDLAYAQLDPAQHHMLTQVARDGYVTIMADPEGLVQAAEDLAELFRLEMVEPDPDNPEQGWLLQLTEKMRAKVDQAREEAA